jgi:hypothetical protein
MNPLQYHPTKLKTIAAQHQLFSLHPDESPIDQFRQDQHFRNDLTTGSMDEPIASTMCLLRYILNALEETFQVIRSIVPGIYADPISSMCKYRQLIPIFIPIATNNRCSSTICKKKICKYILILYGRNKMQ